MSLEQAVRRLTFESASTFGIYDRGLLHPGVAADITVFDPDTVRTLPADVMHDFPAGGWRIREFAEGSTCTIVKGEVLIEDGKPTGALPGRVMHNTLYAEQQVSCQGRCLACFEAPYLGLLGEEVTPKVPCDNTVWLYRLA